MSTFENTWQKLRNKTYREHFVDSQVKRAIPFQIRSIMKARGLSQEQLASLAGLTQGVVSRAASPKYGNLTLNTIVRIAAGFDVAFIGRFVPFSELVRYYDELSENMGEVPTFEQEDEAWSKDVVVHVSPAEDRPSALREALVRAQVPGNIEPLFRLTAPSLNRPPGILVEFRKRGTGTGRSAATELEAVSQ